jgi:hypothetical protein
VFCVLHRFCYTATRRFGEEEPVLLDAEEDYFFVNVASTFPWFDPHEVFPDPATAPLTWTPPVYVPVDEWGDAEDAPEDEPEAADKSAPEPKPKAATVQFEPAPETLF